MHLRLTRRVGRVTPRSARSLHGPTSDRGSVGDCRRRFHGHYSTRLRIFFNVLVLVYLSTAKVGGSEPHQKVRRYLCTLSFETFFSKIVSIPCSSRSTRIDLTYQLKVFHRNGSKSFSGNVRVSILEIFIPPSPPDSRRVCHSRPRY